MKLQAHTASDLHGLIFARLLKRSIGYHTNNISGKLISDAVEFVASFTTLANAIYISGMTFLSVIVVGIIIVLINSWQLGLFLSLTLFVTLIWVWLESRRRASLRTRRLVASKKLTAHLSDSIGNAQTVKT